MARVPARVAVRPWLRRTDAGLQAPARARPMAPDDSRRLRMPHESGSRRRQNPAPTARYPRHQAVQAGTAADGAMPSRKHPWRRRRCVHRPRPVRVRPRSPQQACPSPLPNAMRGQHCAGAVMVPLYAHLPGDAEQRAGVLRQSSQNALVDRARSFAIAASVGRQRRLANASLSVICIRLSCKDRARMEICNKTGRAVRSCARD